jgi:hypothetical protein
MVRDTKSCLQRQGAVVQVYRWEDNECPGTQVLTVVSWRNVSIYTVRIRFEKPTWNSSLKFSIHGQLNHLFCHDGIVVVGSR